MNVKDFMVKHLYKEEVQDLAKNLSLDKSGKKEDIILRILSCKDFELDDLTEYFYKEQFVGLCWNLNLPISGSKETLWNRIVDELKLDINQTLKELEKKEKKSLEAKSEIIKEKALEAKSEIIEENEEVIQLERIIQQWFPARRYKTEEGFQTELRSILEHKYSLKVQDEAGPTQVDILVNDSTPIELKKNPKREDFDRLTGQIDRNIELYGKIIIVICQLETRDLFLEYKNRLERRHSPEELIFIVK